MTTAQQEILKNFTHYLHQIGYSKTTQYEIAYCVEEFLETIKKEAENIEQTDILDFYQYLQHRPLKNKTGTLSANMITHYVYGLKMFFNWLEQTDQLKENPISSLKFKRPEYQPREPLTQAEVQQLYQAAETAREKAILHLFYSCGLRRSEAESLNTGDIHFTKNMLYVREGKGAKRRAIPINETVKNELENYCHTERKNYKNVKDEKAFILNKPGGRMRGDGYNRALKEIIKQALKASPNRGGLEGATLHHLRHSIATHLLENGLKIEFVRDFLGHAHLETTQIYAKVKSQPIEELMLSTDKNKHLRNPDARLSGNLETYLQQHYSPKTTKAYQREIDSYTSNNPNAETYHYKEIIHYIGILRKRYSNASTLNRILASIKAYYGFLAYSGARKDNPSKSINLKDKQSRDIQLQDLFSTEELESLLNAKVERYTNLGYRNKVLISLFIYQALKPAEIEGLECQEINLEAATVYLKSSPKNNSRTLSLRANQILLFKNYLEETRVKLLQNKLIPSFIIGYRGEPMKAEDITKHIKRSYGKMYNPRKITAQTIRQSVITNLLKQKHDLRIVQTFAGHKYPSATERYKQANVDALQTALKQYHPIK